MVDNHARSKPLYIEAADSNNKGTAKRCFKKLFEQRVAGGVRAG